MKYETPLMEIVAFGADSAMAADTEVDMDASIFFSPNSQPN